MIRQIPAIVLKREAADVLAPTFGTLMFRAAAISLLGNFVIGKSHVQRVSDITSSTIAEEKNSV